MSTRQNILAVIDTPAECAAIYKHVREVFRLTKNGCAATCCLILRRAGVTLPMVWLCSLLVKSLTALGWPRETDTSGLHDGAVCFSVNGNSIPGPDHVYIFLGWLDEQKQVARVYDNYSPQPHARNIGAACWYKGKRLAKGRFDFALIPPN